ncbi:RpiB/LacA/LacB family sugar-phosphate isomerase [Patescibacteria group bacterium]|nr:RpiB/LacA/LacB family sugar-phosphate isomerase [Patescibacteria group bacterium]MBU1922486.1 RpiB/LacA/LacB family sugar-phosphate isomerase [Patescibacteria group bacterium]
MKIYLGADHAGHKLKEELEKYLKKQKHAVIDLGAHKFDKTDDYPIYAARVGRAARRDKKARGIVLCGNAQGVCIVANKIRDVRAAVGYSEDAAKTSRADDNANVLCLAGRVLKPAQAKKIVSTFLKTKFSHAKRHRRRLKEVARIEKAGSSFLTKQRREHKIIPAILARDALDFAKKLRLIEGAALLAQIDVVDGKFARPASWADPDIIKTIPTPVKYELHLMVKDSAQEMKKWSGVKNVQTVIFHAETKQNRKKLIQAIKRKKWRAGVALNPRTPIKKIKSLADRLNKILVLGVTPGRSGQKFQKPVLKKISELKKQRPKLIISVDGGVKLGNAEEILAAGADQLCVASAIYRQKNPKKAIQQFKQIKINK